MIKPVKIIKSAFETAVDTIKKDPIGTEYSYDAIVDHFELETYDEYLIRAKIARVNVMLEPLGLNLRKMRGEDAYELHGPNALGKKMIGYQKRSRNSGERALQIAQNIENCVNLDPHFAPVIREIKKNNAKVVVLLSTPIDAYAIAVADIRRRNSKKKAAKK